MPEDKAVRPNVYVREPGGYEERGYRPIAVSPRPSRPPQTPPAKPPARKGGSSVDPNESER